MEEIQIPCYSDYATSNVSSDVNELQSKEGPVRRGCIHEIILIVNSIPKVLTQKLFRQFLEELGFEGQFDFIYVPWVFGKPCSDGKRRRSNSSYAFANFVSLEAAAKAKQVMHGMIFPGKAGDNIATAKELHVQAAKTQGLYKNLKGMMHSRTNLIKNKKYRPLVMHNGVDMAWDRVVDMINLSQPQRAVDGTSRPSSDNSRDLTNTGSSNPQRRWDDFQGPQGSP